MKVYANNTACLTNIKWLNTFVKHDVLIKVLKCIDEINFLLTAIIYRTILSLTVHLDKLM